MGWIRNTGKFVATEGGYIAGVEHMRVGSRLIKQNWGRLRAHVCPACNDGRLFPFHEIIDGKKMAFRGCNVCDHYQAVVIESDPESVKRLRSIALDKVRMMDGVEYLSLVRRFKIVSRIFYGMSSAMMLFAGYILVFDHTLKFFDNPGRTFLGVLMVSAWMFVQGLSASYRFWQTREKKFFVPGSFKKWIGIGQWLV
jgi:hypothetical protein